MKKHKLALLLILISISTMAQDVSTLIPKIKEAIFTVYAEDAEHSTFASGSGFFIAETGIGVTNFHVLNGAEYGHIEDCNGKEYRISHIIDYNPAYDLIKFQVERASVPSFKYLRINNNLPQQGEAIVSYSNPLGLLANTVSTGIISAIRELTGYETVLQITAPISHGSSGSPVVNKSGEVVGISTFGIEAGQSLNFAVSVKQLNKLNRNLRIQVGDMQENELATPLIRAARIAGEKQDYQRAIQLLNTELQKNQTNHLALYYRGLYKCRLYGAENTEDGIDDLMQACFADNTNYEYYCTTAGSLKNIIIKIFDMNQVPPMDLVKVTAQLYFTCFELDPNRSEAYAEFGYMNIYLGQLEYAIQFISNAIENYPTPTYYVYRAEAYSKSNNSGAAILDCNKALSLDPNFWRAYSIRGEVRCFDMYQFNDGIMDITMAEALAPTTHYKAEMNALLGEAYSKKAMFSKESSIMDFSMAIQYLEKAYSYEANPFYKEEIKKIKEMQKIMQ